MLILLNFFCVSIVVVCLLYIFDINKQKDANIVNVDVEKPFNGFLVSQHTINSELTLCVDYNQQICYAIDLVIDNEFVRYVLVTNQRELSDVVKKDIVANYKNIDYLKTVYDVYQVIDYYEKKGSVKKV